MVALLCYMQALPSPTSAICTEQCPTSPPYETVSITTDADYRYVSTSTCPPYDNPNWSNPADACVFDNTYKIPRVPKFALQPIPVGEAYGTYEGILYLKEDPEPILGVIGVLRNGVAVFGVGSPCGFSTKCPEDGAPTEWVDAVEAEGHTVDQCGGHAAPTNQYHVHSGIGLVTDTQREDCDLPVDVEGRHSKLLGWMLDGVGLYGRYSLGGVVPTDLDECGGHTHLLRGSMTYHYHLPDEFPWTIGCFKACPEVSNNQNQLQFLNTDPAYGCTTQ